MLKATLKVVNSAVHQLPREVDIGGAKVQATVPTLVIELLDPETDEHIYRRIAAPTDKQIEAFAEGATIEATFKPKEQH